MSQIAQNVTDADTIKKNNASKATPTGSMTTTMMLILWYYIARFAFCDRYSVRKYGKKLSMVFNVWGSTAGAGTAPNRNEVVSKWAETSSSITSFNVDSSGTYWDTDSNISSLGTD